MGSSGKQRKIKPAPEISRVNREEFGISEADLYRIWQIYYKDRIGSKTSPVEAAGKVMASGVTFNEMKYLLAMSLELITSEYFREGGGPIGKPLGMLN